MEVQLEDGGGSSRQRVEEKWSVIKVPQRVTMFYSSKSKSRAIKRTMITSSQCCFSQLYTFTDL